MVDLVVLNFYFDLVAPFYFLKLNSYFSACERKFGKFFMSLLEAQVSFPSYRTSPYLFTSNIVYFDQKKPILVQILELFEYSGQNSSNNSFQFEMTSQFLFLFCIILQCHDK